LAIIVFTGEVTGNYEFMIQVRGQLKLKEKTENCDHKRLPSSGIELINL
jgi:hypothetical protein